MCYHYNPAHLKRLQKLYPDKFGALEYTDYANGFAKPLMPVIKDRVQLMHWGLIPHWTKGKVGAEKISSMCLNAKIETLSSKPSFRDALQKGQRCLIPAEAFYEWRWEDEKGKVKTKYKIKLTDTSVFYFAGLFSEWVDKVSGKLHETFTLITCGANESMAYIHNMKKRMPTLLLQNDASAWLDQSMTLDELIIISQSQTIIAHVLN